jgi:L-methionine (R)-S-oxide reductase
MDFEGLFIQAQGCVQSESDSPEIKLLALSELLKEAVPHYNWFGFYLAENDERELVLGPYAGEPTDHVRIEYGRGICGQAAETLKTFTVDDVTKESNYLACSLKVRAEIVVPVFHEGALVGEIDIDSHTASAFSDGDRDFLERLAVLVAPVVSSCPRD